MDFRILGLSDLTWISAIACIACLGFGIYMVKTRKPGAIRGFRNNDSYRDMEAYSKRGGILLLALAGACLVMIAVSFFSPTASNIIGLIAFMVFAYFWKKMSDEFGPV
ncbi:MAG: hypothetical protein K5857_06865 [Lachnospiraceae bacterium]|nr:hypothetical protein [Lachnospiraceae bacterium]